MSTRYYVYTTCHPVQECWSLDLHVQDISCFKAHDLCINLKKQQIYYYHRNASTLKLQRCRYFINKISTPLYVHVSCTCGHASKLVKLIELCVGSDARRRK